MNGSPSDGSAWQAKEPIYAPKITPEGRSRGFYREERGSPGQVFRWSTPHAFLHKPPKARGVELKVRSNADKPQTLTVEFRGAEIDRRVLSDHEWHTLSYTLPGDAQAGTEWIVLKVDPPWRVPRDRRIFGVMTRDLRWID